MNEAEEPRPAATLDELDTGDVAKEEEEPEDSDSDDDGDVEDQDNEDEDEDEEDMGPEMDLVNRPNPWLPAYGFQIQHANFSQPAPTHEDLRANDTMLVQQGDFLETILEETSDDLQSDSDRSYWLDSDSETESVIHIKSGQRVPDDKQDGSGSECNSVVPKKRRRRNGSDTDVLGSPRSSTSSRSSSLIQFESLERTCATLSPSSYSFDSLEYNNRLGNNANGSNGNGQRHHHHHHHHHHHQDSCASPDSLEQDYVQLNGYLDPAGDSFFGRPLRPYRSFESLGEKDLGGRDEPRGNLLNGFASHQFGKNCDLSRLARRPRSRRRDPWQLNEMDGYSDYEDSSENLSEPDNDDDYSSSRYNEVDQLLVFGDPNAAYAHTASLDCRNSVDLREFGLEDSDEERRTRESTFLDLKAAARLNLTPGNRRSLDLASLDDDLDEDNAEGGGSLGLSANDDIDPSVQLRRRHHHHHHHHHHHRGSSGSHNRNSVDARQSGGSGGLAAGPAGFNFRFTDKWRSAPSLPASSLLDSLAAATTAVVSSSSSASLLGRYDNYTRVASVPVNLDLCGRSTSSSSITTNENNVVDDDVANFENSARERVESSEERTLSAHDPEEQEPEIEEIEDMADILTMKSHDSSRSLSEDHDIQEPGKIVGEEKVKMKKRAKELSSTPPPTSVKIQDPQNTDILAKINSETPRKLDEENQNVLEEKPLLTSTVKTQDMVKANVMEIALAMENNVDGVVDEAIRQLRREVKEATDKNSPNVKELAAALENAEQMKKGIVDKNVDSKERPLLPNVKNNTSYEIAVKSFFTDNGIRKLDRRKDRPTGPLQGMKLANNDSYELAVSQGYKRKPIQHLDGCEELPEPTSSPTSSNLKISKLVDEMTGSASELSSTNKEYPLYGKIYSKSTENVSTARATRQKQHQLNYEMSLLDRIKKNSDFSLTVVEVSGNDKSPFSSPRVISALDDEVDYPCFLENKPLVAHNDISKNTMSTSSGSSRFVNGEAEKEEEEPESPQKMSYIGEFYPEQMSPESSSRHHHRRPVSKSCEDVRNNRGGGSNAQERLWRLVVEKESTGGGGSNGSTTTTRQRIAAPPPLDYYYYAAAATAESAAVNGGAGAGSSPASAAERDSTSSGLGASLVTLEHEEVFKEASTVQPRSAEMSATAAKRLAMSGEPLRSTSSMNALNTAIPAKEESRKKGGLGGFLQRFSKLRFSGRSKVPRSELQKKTSHSANSAGGGARAGVNGASENKVFPKHDQQAAGVGKRKNEPDYIIIPLHPPEEELRREEQLRQQQQQQQNQHQLNEEIRRPEAPERNTPNTSVVNGRPPVCSGKKPPLPPQSSSQLRTRDQQQQQSSGYVGYGIGGVTTAGSVGGSSSTSRRRAATDLGNPAAIEMAKARAAMLASNGQDGGQARLGNHHHLQQHHHHLQQQPRPVGLLETDLDAPVDPEEALKARSLLNLNGHLHPGGGGGGAHHLQQNQHQQLSQHHSLQYQSGGGGSYQYGGGGGTDEHDHQGVHYLNHPGVGGGGGGGHPSENAPAGHHQRPHKSMEFLLDKENLHFVKPPENELQKVGERVPSEHELRVQRSLQRLNVPDWYKNSPVAKDSASGFRLKRHSDASQHGGWRALGSKTTSLSSLSSSSNRQPSCNTTGTLLSPSPTPPVFSRWSTSLLNSAGSSPANSARSSFNHRQPYLGWRSQERLANPRTPAERLAQNVLPSLHSSKQPPQSPQSNQQQSPQSGTTNQEVRNSIKEVTSAIVHYVQSGQEVVGGGDRLSPRHRPDDWDSSRGGSRSTSPRGSTRLVWMESSFVGIRPVDSPDALPSLSVPQQPTTPQTAASSPSTMATYRTAAGGGETSEDGGGSTPGVCPADDSGSTTDAGLHLDLGAAVAAANLTQDAPLPPPPAPSGQQDHRHRQRRHRREQQQRRDSTPSPTREEKPHRHHHHHHRHRSATDTPEKQQQQQQQQQQRGELLLA